MNVLQLPNLIKENFKPNSASIYRLVENFEQFLPMAYTLGYMCLWSLCVFVLGPSIFPSGEGRMWVLSSECKIEQASFTDWMSFLPSKFMGEIILNLVALSANT